MTSCLKFFYDIQGGGAIVSPRKSLSTTTMKEGKRIVPAREVSVLVKEGGDLSMKDDCDHPNQKKPRRCWSPALHNQFVDALLNLGGPYGKYPLNHDFQIVRGLS